MRFPFPKTALAIMFSAALGARADIPPDDDEKLVPVTFGVGNAEADPSKIILACEFYPGGGAPKVAYRLRDRTRSGILYYKFDRIRLYWAKASDWDMLREEHGVFDEPPAGRITEPDREGWKPQGETHDGDWLVGGARLTVIAGDVMAGNQILGKSDPLASVEMIYAVTGLDGKPQADPARRIEKYSDGRAPVVTEYKPLATGIDLLSPPRHSARVSFGPYGWRLRLASDRWGAATVALFGPDGTRLWASHRVLAGGLEQDVDLPRLAAGRYILAVDGQGWRQAFPLKF